MKRLLSMVLAAMLVLSTVIITTEPVSAATSDWQFYGSTCTSNSSAASTINYIRAKYDHYSKYTGSGECYGWAEKVGNMLASSRSYKEYTALKFNKKNFKAKCLNIKAGAHLRLSDEKKYNPWRGHSICLLKVTNNRVCWTDNNYAGDNVIAYYSATLDEFVDRYDHYDYLNMLTKTTKYKTQTEPSVAIEKENDSTIKLFWTRTSSTSKYKVYRATSKNGSYKLIKTTTSKIYKDTSAKPGKKYYYKVKSVKKNGSTRTSNITYGTCRLGTPVISTSIQERTGKIKVSWKKIPKASKYAVYRGTGYGNSFKRIATTTSLSYVDKKVSNPTKGYSYKVKALYSSNSKGNSSYSNICYYVYCNLAAPELSAEYDETTGNIIVTWERVPYADCYEIIYRTEDEEDYYWDGYVDQGTYEYIFDEVEPGKTYYFKGYTYKEDGYYYWYSDYSKAVKVTVPAEENI